MWRILMFRKMILCAGVLMFAGAVSAQNLTADQPYADEKNKFTLSYMKDFVQKKSGNSIEFSSKDKGVTVTVKVLSAAEAAALAKKQGKNSADTLSVLKSVLDAQKVAKDLDPAMNNLPADAVSQIKATAGSSVKYGMKKNGSNYACKAGVFTNGKVFVSLSYAILEKKGNEKYEKPAGAMLKSFAFTE